MAASLNSLTIRGFKSIESLESFKAGSLSVLIGPNGAGKSNFVSFFRLLRALVEEGLQSFVTQQGGGDSFFFLGPRHTAEIQARLEFGQNVYEFDLQPTADNRLMLAAERVEWTGGGGMQTISSGRLESVLKNQKDEESIWGRWKGVSHHVYAAVSSWTVYHFHDTSSFALMRREQSVRDRDRLRPDAANLAAFLLFMRSAYPESYALIRDTVRMIAPFFDDFVLQPEEKGGEEKVRLEWRQRGSDFPFQPAQLSDGTIRFICLATALFQPRLPATVLIDEPELGLHPYAISLLADLIQSAAVRTQVVISTQSPALLDHFDSKDIVVVNRRNGRSYFERLEPADLTEWLEEYSLGELWRKNVVRGGVEV